MRGVLRIGSTVCALCCTCFVASRRFREFHNRTPWEPLARPFSRWGRRLGTRGEARARRRNIPPVCSPPQRAGAEGSLTMRQRMATTRGKEQVFQGGDSFTRSPAESRLCHIRAAALHVPPFCFPAFHVSLRYATEMKRDPTKRTKAQFRTCPLRCKKEGGGRNEYFIPTPP